MSDRLYLSCWLNDFDGTNMLDHFGKLLEIFPESKLQRRNAILRVYAIEYAEPPLLERPLEPDTDVDEILAIAREVTQTDCSVEVETAWDLWQYGQVARDPSSDEEDDYYAAESAEGEKLDWQVSPATVRLICMGPDFASDDGDHLRIDFGLDSQFLPQPEVQGSLDMQQSNLRSLLTLTGELSTAMDLESRQLWSESGVNFADVLAGAVQQFGPN